MAFIHQDVVINQILTAAIYNQTEQNILDHQHGVAGVSALTGHEDAVAVLDSAAAQLAFNTSTLEETLYTKSISGGTLGTNRGVILLFIGDLKNNSGGDATVTVRIKFGSRTMHSKTTLLGTDANERTWRVYVELFAGNLTNVQRAYIEHLIGTATIGDTTGENIDAMPVRNIVRDTAVTQDSTVAQTLAVTAQWTVSSAQVESVRRSARLLVLN